jgi:uncharacterized protein YigA (DUF484 family)
MNANDIALFLKDHPDFFIEHADVFGALRVPQAHGGQAISLADRQLQTVRDKAKVLELRLADLVRHAKDNEGIQDKLFAWARTLLALPEDVQLPTALTASLAEQFDVPMAAIKLWGLAPAYVESAYARDVSDNVRVFANGLMAPFCGDNTGVEAARWLQARDGAAAERAQSIALIPLRVRGRSECFGLLVLGSVDPERFAPTMGTAFLARIGELAGAALSRLLAQAATADAR